MNFPILQGYGNQISFGFSLFLIFLAGSSSRLYFARRWRLPDSGRPAGISFIYKMASFASRFLGSAIVLLLSLFFSGVIPVAFPFPSHPDARAYYDAWCALWGIILFWSILEAAFIESVISLKGECRIPNLVRGVCRVTIIFGFFCIILRSMLGYNISVLLTSTAILTGIIGFAMQGVVGNLLSGLSINTVGIIELGDFIKVGDDEGIVREINWRETRLETGGGNVLVIPNGQLANATITNFYKGKSPSRLEINVSASYDDEPEKVIQALEDAANEQPFVRKKPAAMAIMTGFMDFCINYKLRFWVDDAWNYPVYNSDVERAIWYKFKRAGIEIPFPMSGRLLQDFLDASARLAEKAPPDVHDTGKLLTDILSTDFVAKILVDDDGTQLLSPDALKSVLGEIGRVLYAPGEFIFRQGVRDDESLYILLRGKIKGVALLGGGRRVDFEVAAGEVIGEMSLLTGAPRSATLRSEGYTELIRIPPAAFAPLIRDTPALQEHLAKIVAKRQAKNEQSAVSEVSNHDVKKASGRLFDRFRRIFSSSASNGANANV